MTTHAPALPGPTIGPPWRPLGPQRLRLGALALRASACGCVGLRVDADRERAPAVRQGRAERRLLLAGPQVTKGVVHNDQYSLDDYGLSVDVALALNGVGAEGTTVQAISDRLASHIGDYTVPGLRDGDVGRQHRQGGRAGPGRRGDPTSYGGKDLVAQLEDTVGGPRAGRGADPGRRRPAREECRRLRQRDRPGVRRHGPRRRGQRRGRRRDRLPARPAVLRRLVPARLRRRRGASDQGCDGDKSSKPDLDATAFAVQALSADDSAQAASRVDAATPGWRSSRPRTARSGAAARPPDAEQQQHRPGRDRAGATGRHRGGGEGRRLGVRAPDRATARPPTRPTSGAIAYDDAAQPAAEKKGITAKTSDQFRRATAQALPVLQWLPVRRGDRDRRELLRWDCRAASCASPSSPSRRRRRRCCPVRRLGLARSHRGLLGRARGDRRGRVQRARRPTTCGRCDVDGGGRTARPAARGQRARARLRPAPAGVRLPGRRPADRRTRASTPPPTTRTGRCGGPTGPRPPGLRHHAASGRSTIPDGGSVALAWDGGRAT